MTTTSTREEAYTISEMASLTGVSMHTFATMNGLDSSISIDTRAGIAVILPVTSIKWSSSAG
jgi:hypothetical protein